MNNAKGGRIDQEQQDYYSNGCTDGCGRFFSHWNCTKADCTADCR